LAPDFTLGTHNEGELNLSWYRGRHNILLAFYPGDWTPACSAQIPSYQENFEFINRHNCQVFCVSVDSLACHAAWAKSLGGLSFPLMSDFWPHGGVARKYGVLDDNGFARRTVFLIDMAGTIRFIGRYDYAQVPDNRELFDKLEEIHGEGGAK
jgi:peroxiredoxin